MIGESLLHYRLVAKLGEGGMAEVYRAEDTRLGRTVALKVLPARPGSDPKLQQRFLREAKAAAALSHPNIVGIYEIGSDRDIDFIAMELVEGEPVSKRLRAGPLSIPDALSFATQIAAALAKAHAAGVVHRDLKPSNAMVTPDGMVKLLDFGLAQLNPFASSETVSRITESGVLLGTYAYMSPEQARTEPVDQRSDVFSFGVMLYEMLAGARPFDAPNTVEMLHKTMYFTPPAVQERRAGVPAALAEIVAKCLQKDRAARFQSMEPVADELRSMQRAMDSNPGIAQSLLAPAKVQRRRYLWPAVAAAGILLAGGAWQVSRKGSLAAAMHLPSEAAELGREGQAYLLRFDRSGNTDKAIEACQKALALQRNSASAYAGLGLAYAQKYFDNPDPEWLRLARSNASEALRLNSLLALSHVSMGRAGLVGKDYPEAEKELRRALELEPNNVEAQLNLGQALAMRRRLREAEAAYHKVIETHPEDWRAYQFLAGLLYGGGRYGEAEAALVKASTLAPDNVAVYKILGATYHMLDRDADAAEVLQKALVIRRSSQILSNLGSIYFYLGRYQDAAEAYRGALDEKGANNFRIWGNLGLAYRFSGNTEKATEAYSEGIRLLDRQLASAPDNVQLHASLALYLSASRQKERALQEVERTRKLPGPDAESLFDLGVASELAGRRDAALKLLAQSVQAGYALRQVQIHPDLVALRSDPGYHLLLLSKTPHEK